MVACSCNMFVDFLPYQFCGMDIVSEQQVHYSTVLL